MKSVSAKRVFGACLAVLFADLANDAIVLRSMVVFHADQLFNPHYGRTKLPNATDVDRIRDEPLNDAMVFQSLKDELPAYIVKANELSNDFSPEIVTLQS